jgi:ATP-dependent Lhr-like helicase
VRRYPSGSPQVAQAWPDATNAEELHDALLWLGCLTDKEVRAGPGWKDWLETLAREKRVAQLNTDQTTLWVATERLDQFKAMSPRARPRADALLPKDVTQSVWSEEQALVEILRGRLEGLGPVTQTELASPLGLEPRALGSAPLRLGGRGLRFAGSVC